MSFIRAGHARDVLRHPRLGCAAVVLADDLPPHSLDIHQMVQELEPLLIRLVLTQEPVNQALAAGFAPISVGVKLFVVEGVQVRNRLLSVRGKGVHVCVGFRV